MEGCTALTNLVFSENAVLKYVGTKAFKGCTELRALTLPPSLEDIGDEAFMGCSYLDNVIVPGSVKRVGARAFKNCTGFTGALIEYGVESLGDEAFYGDWRISEVDIPSSVTNIGVNAFGGDSSIIRVGIRGDVRKVSEIFSNYAILREATVKEGDGAIVDGLFEGCAELADVHFLGNSPELANDGRNIFGGTPETLTTYVATTSTGWDGTKGSHSLPQAWPLVGNRRPIAQWDLPTYLVLFDSNGGTLGVQSTYQYSERKFTLPPEPVQTGYTFAGWWTKPVGGLRVTGDTVFIEGVYRTLYAHWTKGRWVFLDPNGGTVENAFVTYIEQTEYGALPTPVRTGYAFDGWTYNGKTVLATDELLADEDHALIAEWRRNKYTVAFGANGGNGGVTKELEYASEIVPPVVTREGYTFVKWEPEVSATVPASNVTYTAQWELNEYTIMLNLNGGEGEAAVVVKHGSVVGDIPVPAKALNEFAGWFTDAEGGDCVDESVTITGALELFAHWNRTHYVVSFDANGGFLAAEDATIVVASGGALDDRALPVPTRDGQLFLGWFTTEDDGEKIDVNVTITDDVAYYAHWIPTTTILVDVNESYTAGADGSFTLSLLEIVFSASTPNLTVKGLPTGLKYDAKTMKISGKATKPGVYEVTVSATNATVKKPVTATFSLVVPNLTCDALPNLMPETDAYGTISCGVAFDPGLVDCSPEDGWTVKVAGLPAGLKYDAKTGKITGVPTKAGTFTVTFTATRGKEKETATITLATEALPDWAAGTFTGYVKENGGSTVFGPATMTVAASGKISGKFTLSGTNWTFAAASYAAVDGEGFIVDTVAKAGMATMPVEMRLYGSTSPETDGKPLVNASAEGGFGGSDDTYIYLWRNMWKDKATSAEAKAVLAGWEGVYTLSMEDGGYMSLTVGKNGDVKVAGKLADGTALSATSPFMYDICNDFFTVFTLSPSAYKGGFVYLPVGFGTERGRIDGLGDGLVWSSRNPQATGAYGEGFERWTSFTGAYYDTAKKLSDYYETLRFATEAPVLYYTFKETYLGGNNRKTTESYMADAYAADTLGQEGTTVSVNGKGAIVVAKATKPVQDKETKEWYYSGANDGALTLSFAQATGIFKGSYTFWYDYMSAYDDTKPDGKRETYAHASKKVSFEGILVQGEEPKMNGFYLWDATGVYEDEKTGKEKTYKYKVSFPVAFGE